MRRFRFERASPLTSERHTQRALRVQMARLIGSTKPR